MLLFLHPSRVVSSGDHDFAEHRITIARVTVVCFVANALHRGEA